MDSDSENFREPGIDVCACANLRRTTRLVTQAYDAALKPAGLRATQFTALSVLANNPEIRQSDLAELMGMDGTTLTRNLQILMKAGWIRIDRAEDQRVRLISITESGQQVLDRAVPLWRAVQAKFVSGLGDSNWAGFLGGLSRATDIAESG